jgi:hypothetical protein
VRTARPIHVTPFSEWFTSGGSLWREEPKPSRRAARCTESLTCTQRLRASSVMEKHDRSRIPRSIDCQGLYSGLTMYATGAPSGFHSNITNALALFWRHCREALGLSFGFPALATEGDSVGVLFHATPRNSARHARHAECATCLFHSQRNRSRSLARSFSFLLSAEWTARTLIFGSGGSPYADLYHLGNAYA